MENKLLDILKQLDSKGHPKYYDIHELNKALGLKTTEDFKELIKTVNKLEEGFQVYRTNKDRFVYFDYQDKVLLGTLIVNKKGFGFVDVKGNEDVYVVANDMNGAIHGDVVAVEVTHKKIDKLSGRIVNVDYSKRKLDNFIGEVYIVDNNSFIDLDDEKVKLTIALDKNKLLGAVEGHKVIVKATKKIGENRYLGEVIRVLGHKNDPGMDILVVVKKYNIRDEFPDTVMAEANALPSEICEADLEGRKDLRGEEIYTIDGDDTKDIDDAISIKLLENGNYQLGVHIADVSYYVKEGSALDNEAFLRGTSNYLADRVIPMYPHVLSNGICSLNPNVDRLTQTCLMEIDKYGNIVNYDIFPSVIHSHIQMTYNKVNKIFNNEETPEGYGPYKDSLLKFRDLAHILRKNKDQRGMLDFNIDESKIIVDETGKAVDVKLRSRGEGERLIEDLMIVANETVATHHFHLEYPFLYRVHGKPKKEKIENFIKFISLLGYKVEGQIHNDDSKKDKKKNDKKSKNKAEVAVHDVHSKTMQNILKSLEDKKEFLILSRLLLRSMQKAIYDYRNIGHFGLASEIYCHFTSPIRRYPDTIVHRLNRDLIFNNNIDMANLDKWVQKLIVIGEQSSLKEREAIECEREVDDMKKAEYMSQHIGEEFDGIISSVLSFGFFVELPNLIEGLVRLEELSTSKKEIFEFNEATFSAKSASNPRGYRLGDDVRVKVLSADKDARKIDFGIVDAPNKVK